LSVASRTECSYTQGGGGERGGEKKEKISMILNPAAARRHVRDSSFVPRRDKKADQKGSRADNPTADIALSVTQRIDSTN